MRYYFFALSLFIGTTLLSQEQLGLRLENYAGVNSLTLNPTGHLTNPLKWDVNLLGAGVFFDNNYMYLRQTSTLDLLRRRNSAELILAEDIEGQPPADALILDFYNDGRKRFGYASGFIMGPSVAVKLNDRHSIGIFTRAQAIVGTQNVSNYFSYYKYDRRAFFDPFTVKPLEGAWMSWREIGLNYAFQIPTNSGFMGFGANLRFLQAYEGGFINSMDDLGYTKTSGNSIAWDMPHGKFGFTNSNLDPENFELERNGSGFAMDLGYVQTIQGEEENYKWRFGASLLDIGYLKFNRNARSHEIHVDSTVGIWFPDYERFEYTEELEEAVKVFSYQMTGDSTASLQGNSFKLAMPAALSLQADFSLTKNFFINALLVQRIPTPGLTPARNNLLALTPRFESRWFSASLSAMALNYQDIHFGLAARLGYLVVGSDNVVSIFGNGAYTGTDFYVALKINPFDLNFGLFSGGSGKRKIGGRGKVKCYDF